MLIFKLKDLYKRVRGYSDPYSKVLGERHATEIAFDFSIAEFAMSIKA